MTRTSTTTATAARLVLAVLVTLSIVIAAPAHAAVGDLQAELKPEEPPIPQPKVELIVKVGCEPAHLGYEIELKHGPAGEKTYRFQYREPGSAQHVQLPDHAPTGGLVSLDVLEDLEVRGVVHMVNDPKSFYSDWVLVAAPECDDEPEPEDEPEDEPGDNGGGGNPGPEVKGSDIVQATPNFTG